MRRTTLAIVVLAALGFLAIGPSPASAETLQSPAAPPQAGTCALTSYTLTGTFNRIGGGTTFTLGAGGSCVGTSPTLAVNITFNSVGPWSCVAGVATGNGAFQPSGGVPEIVFATLVNVGGEYVIEMHTANLTAAATGNIITPLPIACAEGQTQTTIGGTGTLTYGATS